MTAKLTASADGSKVLIGTAAEDALQIDATAKTIKALPPYTLAGNGPAFSAFLSANQPVTSSLYRANLNVESLDTDNAFDNGRFTPQVAGWYFIHGRIGVTGTNMTAMLGYIFKNGVAFSASGLGTTITGVEAFVETSALLYLNGSTDYVELWGQVNASADNAFTRDHARTSMSGFLVRAG